MYNVVSILAPSFLVGTYSFLQVTRTAINACTFKIYSFWRDAKSANAGPMLLLKVQPGFALIAVCSSVIHRNIQLAMMRRLWWKCFVDSLTKGILT